MRAVDAHKVPIWGDQKREKLLCMCMEFCAINTIDNTLWFLTNFNDGVWCRFKLYIENGCQTNNSAVHGTDVGKISWW